MKIHHFLMLALLVAASAVGAQEFRGTISGVVTDPSGSAIPNVTVTATETRTGTSQKTVTNAAGEYSIPFLLPGDYQLQAEAQGFKKELRTAVHLASGAHLDIDFKLEVGTVSESVSVTAEVPLINTDNASTAQVITTKQVEDFPLNGRAPMMLAQLAVGVEATSDPSLVHPFDNNGSAAWSISGTPSQTSELLMDGSPDELWSGSLAYSPPQDAVQEVTVDAFNTDAAYGHTYAGTINMVTKSGTNEFHGSMYEFTQASALDANNWFNDENGVTKPLTHFNQYGLTAGGPVIIPKLLNGRNKLFWFFTWENLDDAQPTADLTTVPTDAEKQGDFSSLLALGSSYQIYNPYSGVQNGKVADRIPFQCDASGNPLPVNANGTQASGTACNKIPPSLISPIAQAYLKYYPEPNVAGKSDGFDNYANTNTSADTFDNELGRLDYNMTARDHMFFDFRHNNRLQAKNNYFSNIATGTTLLRENWGSTFDNVYTFSPTLVADVRADWTHMNEVHGDPSIGFNATTLGFPSYIASSSEYPILPAIQFSGSCGSQTSFQCLGNTSDSVDPSDAYQLFADIVKIAGKHSLKFGIDFRRYQFGYTNYAESSGAYGFGSTWTNGPTSTSAASAFGQDFAAFLLGLPSNSGSTPGYTLNSAGVFRSYYYAVFVQDDWRITNTLTLNLGLRFETDTPYGESRARTVNGFDFTAGSPVEGAAQAAFAKAYPSGLPTDNGQPALAAFNVLGGLTFASPGNPAAYQVDSHNFSPRIGFAWSPEALHGSTVFRGGFGIFVSPFAPTNLPTSGNYSSTPFTDQEGFSASTAFVATSNNYLSPAATLSNPFPAGISQPAGPSQGLATFIGQTATFLNPTMHDTYSIRWNFGVQHTITPNLMMEVDYVGNHGVHLPIDVIQYNPIPAAYLSTMSSRDTSVISALSGTTANPFAGLLPGTTLNGSTVSVAQLLSVYPEFLSGWSGGSPSTSQGVLDQNDSEGQSYFNSVDVRIEKRFSQGLSVIGNYSFSKLIEADSFLNFSDPRPERRISPFDHTQHFVTGFSYDLPIGRGRALNLQSRVANLAFGGWTVNGIYTYQTGGPILWSNADYIYNGQPLDYCASCAGRPTFNAAAFDTTSADQLEYHIRTFPSTLSSVRYDAINNFDSSILKNFNVTERVYFQLRLEAFNVLNHPTFGAVTGGGPNMTPTSSAFGELTGQENVPREIQLGARLVW